MKLLFILFFQLPNLEKEREKMKLSIILVMKKEERAM